jgi:hypothetical protein
MGLDSLWALNAQGLDPDEMNSGAPIVIVANDPRKRLGLMYHPQRCSDAVPGDDPRRVSAVSFPLFRQEEKRMARGAAEEANRDAA